MVTEQQARQNLGSAARLVRASLGLPADETAWTYTQRTEYNHALAAKIAATPAAFTPEILTIAANVSATNYTPLEDESFDWGEFASESLGNAPGVLGSFTHKILLGALVLGVVWVLLNSRAAVARAAK